MTELEPSRSKAPRGQNRQIRCRQAVVDQDRGDEPVPSLRARQRQRLLSSLL